MNEKKHWIVRDAVTGNILIGTPTPQLVERVMSAGAGALVLAYKGTTGGWAYVPTPERVRYRSDKNLRAVTIESADGPGHCTFCASSGWILPWGSVMACPYCCRMSEEQAGEAACKWERSHRPTGWALFDVDGNWEVQRDDDSDEYEDDLEAILAATRLYMDTCGQLKGKAPR